MGSLLNEEQERAVTFGDGAVLVVAGAGSGKTRVLIHRIAHLMHERAIPARQILAFTFTNKAAGEMRERVRRLVGDDGRDLWLGTFHSTCLRILRREAGRIDYPRDFSIFNRDDQIALVQRLLKDRDADLKDNPPGLVLSRISSAKNQLITPDEFEASSVTGREQLVATIYRAYQTELLRQRGMDFDDLIGVTAKLLEQNAEVRELYGERFRHVLVDEYQDTNHAQFRLVAGVASGFGNVMAVGDEDQSIYGWRGADIKNVLEFESRFPDATIIRLEQNYRSTSVILEAASEVISNNRNRRGKALWTDRKGGGKIRLLYSGDEQAEGARLGQEIRRFLARGGKASDFAILYRTNAQSRALEVALRQDGVPYQLIGGISFYERREIRDLLAYLRLLVNPRDRVSFLRIANVPRRGLGEKALGAFRQSFKDGSDTPVEVLSQLLQKGALGAAARKGGLALLELLKQLEAAKNEPIDILLEKIIESIDYREYLESQYPQDISDRWDNVEELVASARQFSTLGEQNTAADFVAETALVADVDKLHDDVDRTVMMTAHNAKGLEFSVVAISGCEEGILPHASSFGDEDELEEERRLFYVAMTRAKDEVILSASAFRRRFDGRGAGELSRFVREIPSHLIRTEQPAGWIPGPASRERSRGDQSQSSSSRFVPSGSDEFSGQTVYHETFGKGSILSSSGVGSNRIFQVRFANAGIKKILGRYLLLDD